MTQFRLYELLCGIFNILKIYLHYLNLFHYINITFFLSNIKYIVKRTRKICNGNRKSPNRTISLHKATLNRWSNKGILQNLTTTDSKLKCHQSFPLGIPGHRSIAKTRVVISMRVWPSRKSVVRRCFFFWLCIVVLGHFRRLIWWVSECACNRAGG